MKKTKIQAWAVVPKNGKPTNSNTVICHSRSNARDIKEPSETVKRCTVIVEP